VLATVLVCGASLTANGPVLRLHGSIEPVGSHPGDLLIEFDRQTQLKTASDRRTEYPTSARSATRRSCRCTSPNGNIDSLHTAAPTIIR
jgi:hypothetical protein